MKNRMVILLLTLVSLQSISGFANSSPSDNKTKYGVNDISTKALKSLLLSLGTVEVKGDATKESLSEVIALGLLNKSNFTHLCKPVSRSFRSECTLSITFKPSVGELPEYKVKIDYGIIEPEGTLFPYEVYFSNK